MTFQFSFFMKMIRKHTYYSYLKASFCKVLRYNIRQKLAEAVKIGAVFIFVFSLGDQIDQKDPGARDFPSFICLAAPNALVLVCSKVERPEE